MYPNPPYLMLVFGLFAGVTSGLAFEASLRELVQRWNQDRESVRLADLQTRQLSFPFLGICIGICLFLASGLGVFLLPTWLCYTISAPLTVFIGYLVWSQLQTNLILLDRGGSKAIDLDALE